jgi:hypothetical protein
MADNFLFHHLQQTMKKRNHHNQADATADRRPLSRHRQHFDVERPRRDDIAVAPDAR